MASRRGSATLLAFAAAVILSCAAAPALAHPDIAVTVRTLFELRNGKVVAMGESWTFDKAYSARLLYRFDSDRDGRLGPREAERLAARTLRDLSASNFLSQLKEGMRKVDLPWPSWSAASMAEGAITLSFVFTFDQPLAAKGERAVALQIRDTDYAAAFSLTADRPILLRGDHGRCRTEVEEWPEESYFGGLVMPWEIALSCD